VATYLDDLLDGARRRVAEARAREPLRSLAERAVDAPQSPSFEAALTARGVSVIAEVKRASPSKGPLAPDLDARVQAAAYADGGAAAVSVLTEPDQFDGHLTDLADVASLGLPALRKDFVVDPYQVWEARAAGASAVLLIVAALDEAELEALHREAGDAGLDVLVEVHDEQEAAITRRVGATMVGVNARDLRTFALDRDGFARIRAALPDGAIAVSESGVRDADDVRRAAAEGADAVLVGESLVRAADPAAAVRDLVAAGAPTTSTSSEPA
jgi:indole-3-glycerol phosphate synthase